MSDENKNNLENEVKETANEFKEGWNQATAGGENKKMIAGILGILLGGFGIHKFVLGYTKEGIIQIVITFIYLWSRKHRRVNRRNHLFNKIR